MLYLLPLTLKVGKELRGLGGRKPGAARAGMLDVRDSDLSLSSRRFSSVFTIQRISEAFSVKGNNCPAMGARGRMVLSGQLGEAGLRK